MSVPTNRSPARASLMTGLLPHNHGVLQVEHGVDQDQAVLREHCPKGAPVAGPVAMSGRTLPGLHCCDTSCAPPPRWAAAGASVLVSLGSPFIARQPARPKAQLSG